MENSGNGGTPEGPGIKSFGKAVQNLADAPVMEKTIKLDIATQVFCSMLTTREVMSDSVYRSVSEYRSVAEHALRATNELIKAYVKDE